MRGAKKTDDDELRMSRSGSLTRDLPPSVAGYWRNRRVWDRFREEEHPVIGQIHREQREFVVSIIRDFAGHQDSPINVVDLGCGTGRVACDLMGLARVRELLAVDINAQAVRKVAAAAAKLGLQEKLRVRSGNFYELAWKAEGVFDVAVCMDVLHHLPDVPGMLGIIRGRLKPGGIFVGNIRSAEGTDTFFHRYGLVKRTLIKVQPMADRAIPNKSTLRRWLGDIGYLRIRTYTQAQTRRLLEAAGFRITRFDSSFYHSFVCTPGE
jgi:SAM-dependent methyltransferase